MCCFFCEFDALLQSLMKSQLFSNRLYVLMDLSSAILKQYGGFPLETETQQTRAKWNSM